MPEQLLTILQICLLVLLYLFLARVVRAVWVEVGGGSRRVRSTRTAPEPSPSPAPTTPPVPSTLVFVEPRERQGQSVALAPTTTIGRAAGSTLIVDDAYLSQQHAQICSSGGTWIVEDLGSTNGTYVNDTRLTGPTTLSVGDRIQLGDTVLEVV